MKNSNKTKLTHYVEGTGFLFEHNYEEVIKIFKNKYRHARSLLPFFRKIENNTFHTGYIAGYEDGYNDAFKNLLDELGIERDTGHLQKDIEKIKDYWLKNKKT